MDYAALAARPAAAVLVLLWATSVVPPLTSIAVAAAVTAFCAPFAVGTAVAASSSSAAALAELGRGAVLGLGAAAPVWAALTAGRWAGERLRLGGGRSPVTALYAAMLGVAFVAVDGPALLCAALAKSYATAPAAAPWTLDALRWGAVAEWLAVAVRLALPILLTVAVAELAVAAAQRAGAATAAWWPASAAAPTIVLLITAALVPLLVAAMATALRHGWAA
ncbi:MAG: flagellar biosynthetic protein FliR [Kofleriaceae bacterium]